MNQLKLFLWIFAASTAIFFAFSAVYAQTSDSYFVKRYYDKDRAFSLAIPRNWVTNESSFIDLTFINLNGATVHFFKTYPQSDKESRLTRSVNVQYAEATDWFGVPYFLVGILSHDDLVNLYIDQQLRSSVNFKVLNADVKKLYGTNVYDVESESLQSDKLLYHGIERFVFVGSRVYYIAGYYLSSQPQYREIVLADMDSFQIIQK